MKKKVIHIITTILIIVIAFVTLLYLNSNYSTSLMINWGFHMPIKSRCIEIYEQDTGDSFHGDGNRYHVFSYKYEDGIDSMQEYMSKDERSILISSHISSDLENLCDDFYMIHDGKIIMHEETDVLLSEYGILKPTLEQYQNLDKQYLLRVKKETFGYRCLTNERQFYVENYPEVVIERGNIDEMILLMVRGEAV